MTLGYRAIFNQLTKRTASRFLALVVERQDDKAVGVLKVREQNGKASVTWALLAKATGPWLSELDKKKGDPIGRLFLQKSSSSTNYHRMTYLGMHLVGIHGCNQFRIAMETDRGH